MKRMFNVLVLTIFLLNTCLAQKSSEVIDNKEVFIKQNEAGHYVFEEVVAEHSISKQEMYKKAKEWVLTTLKTGDKNLIFDEQNMKIINSGAVAIDALSKTLVPYSVCNFKISIEFKDEKWRFVFDNIELQLGITLGQSKIIENLSYGMLDKMNIEKKTLTNKQYEKLKIDINKKLKNLSNDLKKAIASTTKDNDW